MEGRLSLGARLDCCATNVKLAFLADKTFQWESLKSCSLSSVLCFRKFDGIGLSGDSGNSIRMHVSRMCWLSGSLRPCSKISEELLAKDWLKGRSIKGAWFLFQTWGHLDLDQGLTPGGTEMWVLGHLSETVKRCFDQFVFQKAMHVHRSVE